MLVTIITVLSCLSLIKAQEGEIIVTDNKTQCIDDLLQWCSSMKYPEQSAGMSMLSVTYEDPSGYYSAFCSSDSEGTNCTKNQNPWFACTPDHKMMYKGQIISSNISTNVDDDICSTADKAFNELFVQNLSYDNTTLKKVVHKGFEEFFEQIAALQEQIDLIQKRLDSLPFFMGGSYSGFFYQNPEAGETMILLDDDSQDVPNQEPNNEQIYTEQVTDEVKQNSTDEVMQNSTDQITTEEKRNTTEQINAVAVE